MTEIGERKVLPRYSITADQFTSGLITDVQPYKFPNQITRENFTPFFIDSFAKAQGIEAAHWAYLEWLSIKTGFDYESTLKNFQSAGLYRSLIEPEKQMYRDAYARVNIHREKRAYKEDERNIEKGLEVTIRKLLDPEEQKKFQVPFATPYLASLSTRSQLMDYLNMQIKTVK